MCLSSAEPAIEQTAVPAQIECLVTVRLYDGENDYYECLATDEDDAKRQARGAYLRCGTVISVMTI